MSNIIDINELRKSMNDKRSLEDWKMFAEAAYHSLEKYQEEIEFLNKKILSLETMLVSRHPSLITELTPEETICIQQINELKKVSDSRAFTLEEVKKLDLLVKNLKLLREESTIVVNNKGVENLEVQDLVAIATGKQSE